MHSKCDILILTARFGNGHIIASNAIKEYIQIQNSNINIKIVDLYEIINPILYKSMYKGYEMLIKNGYKLYNMYYYKKNNSDLLLKIDTASKTSYQRFEKYIDEVNPKTIISTFPICTGYTAKYKRKRSSSIPLLTCITDIVDSNEWIYEENDVYFVPTKDIKDKLIMKGIEDNKIEITGIPIRRKFIKNMNKNSLREEYGYSHEDFIILMMGGGLGILPDEDEFYNWISSEYKNIKIIIITGNNKNLYNKLNKVEEKIDNIKVIEYTDNVAEYMNMADLLISKAGGITLFEAIASKLPLIIYKPTLGQEMENSKFVEEESIGYVADNVEELKNTINEILVHSEKTEIILESLDDISKNINMNKLVDKILLLYYEEQMNKIYSL